MFCVGPYIHVRGDRGANLCACIDSQLGHSHFHGVSSELDTVSVGPHTQPEIPAAASGLLFDPQRIVRPLPRLYACQRMLHVFEFECVMCAKCMHVDISVN